MKLVIFSFGIIAAVVLLLFSDIRHLRKKADIVKAAALMGIGILLYLYLNMTADLSATVYLLEGSLCLIAFSTVLLICFPGAFVKKLLDRLKRLHYCVLFVLLCGALVMFQQILYIPSFNCFFAMITAVVLVKWIKYEWKIYTKVSVVLICLLQAVMMLLLTNLSGGSVGNISSIMGVLPLFLLVMGVHILTVFGLKLPQYILFAVIGLFGVVNAVVVCLRGTPFLPEDIFAAATAANVADQYVFSLQLNLVAILFIICCLFFSAGVPKAKKSISLKKGIIYALMSVFCFALALSKFCYSSVALNKWSTLFIIEEESYFRTFMAYFYEQIEGAFFVPEGYDLESVNEIMEENKQEASDTEDSVKPNIIVIMNEGFADLSVVGEFETDEDYMPFINSLSGENVLRDKLVARRAGGTATTESEFLLSTAEANYFSSLPYVRNIKSDIPSLVSVLEESGYYTTAFHPAPKGNYNRLYVYEYMGFDKRLFDEDMTVEQKLYDGFVSDETDFEQLIALYEEKPENQPMFLFNVTLQNHSPYDNVDIEDRIAITSFDADEDVESYLACIKETDKAFEQLLEYFSEEEEPVIILMFGDHQPGISESFYENIYQKDMSSLTNEENQNCITVPYIFWANYDVEFEPLGTVSANYLAPYLLQTAGLPMSDFQEYVRKLQEMVPIMQKNGYVDKEGNYYSYEDENEYYDKLQEYRLLTYHYIFDSENRQDEFFE